MPLEGRPWLGGGRALLIGSAEDDRRDRADSNNVRGQDAPTSPCDSIKQIMVPTPDSLIQLVRDRAIECAPPTSSQAMQ